VPVRDHADAIQYHRTAYAVFPSSSANNARLRLVAPARRRGGPRARRTHQRKQRRRRRLL
jgi:hypothetical protein